jgi:hypothetical protein
VNPQFATLIIQSAAATFAVGRLVYLRLARRFPALLGFLVLFALSEGVLAVLLPRSPTYFWIYLAYIPLECILSVFVVGEIFALVFADYPGIQTIGRWVIYLGMTASVAASVVIARIFWRGGAGHRDSRLFYLEIGQRSVVFILAIVIATILFVLSRYPLHLDRNTYFSSLFFSLFFLSDAARLLIDSLTPSLYNHYVDGTESFIITAILAVWAILLQPAPATGLPRISFSTPAEAHLLEQLASLNEVMGRSAQG